MVKEDGIEKTEQLSPLPRGCRCEQTMARRVYSWITLKYFSSYVDNSPLKCDICSLPPTVFCPPRRAARDPTPFVDQRYKRRSLCEPEEKQTTARLSRRGHSTPCVLPIYLIRFLRFLNQDKRILSQMDTWCAAVAKSFIPALTLPHSQKTGIFGFPHLILLWDTPLSTPADFSGAPWCTQIPYAIHSRTSLICCPISTPRTHTASTALEVRNNWHGLDICKAQLK